MKHPSFKPTKIDKSLLNCLHQDEDRRKAICETSLDDTQWHAFLQTAIRHSVSALLFYRLKTGGQLSVMPVPVQKALFDCYLGNSARNMQIFFCLKEILKAFHAENIPAITLKGAHLAHTAYENISVREMSDIDLMVPPDKLKAADRVLLDLGYLPDAPCDIDFEMKHFLHLPQYNKPRSPAIEIHWTIANPKPPCCFDVAQLWRETNRFRIQGVESQGLSLELLLVHLCSHISHQHGFTPGLRSYYDIAIILNRFASVLNLRQVEDITVTSGVKRGVYLSLFLAKELLGAKVPGEILKRLKPSFMNNPIMTMAKQTILEENATQNLNQANARVFGRKGVWRKAKGMVQQVFLPRKTLARNYGLAPDSLQVFLYYPILLKDLFRRNKRLLWNFVRRDDKITLQTERISILEDWLSGKGS